MAPVILRVSSIQKSAVRNFATCRRDDFLHSHIPACVPSPPTPLSRNRTSQIGRLLEVALRAACILSPAPAGANQSAERVKSRWTDGHALLHFQPFSRGSNYETENRWFYIESRIMARRVKSQTSTCRANSKGLISWVDKFSRTTN